MKKKLLYSKNTPLRIDSFIKSKMSFLTKSEMLKLFASNKILINNRRAKKGDKLTNGDEVCIFSFPSKEELNLKPDKKLVPEIIYQDRHLLAFNKPRAVPSHPIHFSDKKTMLNAIISHFPETKENREKPLEGLMLHRLDNYTSGLLLVARSQNAYKIFRDLFKQKAIRKKYIALVHGQLRKKLTIDVPLMRDPKNKKKMRRVTKRELKNQKKRIFFCQTEVHPKKIFSKFTLVEISLKSAVTHQIRVHLFHIGFPIVGDILYKSTNTKPSEELPLKGQFLHASEIKFTHPMINKKITITCGLGNELNEILRGLD